MIVAYLLLAAPIIAAALLWGTWVWVAAAAAVFVLQYVALHRSQRFSARVWRSVGVGRRSSRERVTERLYVVTASVGVLLLAGALVGGLTL